MKLLREERRDRWLVWALGTGFALRLVLPLVFGFGAAVRDEALYLRLAEELLAGQGLGSHRGWLWAPGYPAFLAALDGLTPGSVHHALPWAQGFAATLQILWIYLIGKKLFSVPVGRLAAWIVALHPTLIFFSGRAWSEGIYVPVLVGAIWALLWAREGPWGRGVVPGLLLGALVLLRGMAQSLPPVFLLAMLWPDRQPWSEALRRRGSGALAMGLAAVITVAPYSFHASTTHGGLILSDATVGNLMFLGNNDFPPLTFDLGNGVLGPAARRHHFREGRPRCTQENPVEWNRCEVERGREWIEANPDAFIARIPLRLAQLLNPHGFFSRALRWGKYEGLPWAAKEGLILGSALASIALILGGSLGALARGRGPYAVLLWGVVGTTALASAALYGMSRFRLPLEPLWAVYLAALLCEPRASLAQLRAHPLRWILAAAMMPILVWLTFWFFPSAWPGLFP